MRPNIVVISMDDAIAYWKYRRVFGKRLMTPSLDEICAQSTAFLAAYCQSPLCGPSRASFMSARAPHDTRVFDNRTSIFDAVPPTQMWAYRLREDGFFCSSGGKVHHGFRPLPEEVHTQLYDDARKHFRIDIRLPETKPQVKLGGHAGGLATTDPDDDGYYYDAHSAASFRSFIDSYDGDRPFYREVGFFGPHGPFITPLPYKQMYRLPTLHQPAEWAGGYDRNAFAEAHMKTNFNTAKTKYWKRSLRNYFSAFTHVDHHIGAVWQALKSSRFADNTVVVILADHGFHLGEKNRFRKTSLWEQVAGVPLIIHDPRRPEARKVTDPVALIDIGRTVLDYAGVPPLNSYRGRSLRPQVEGAPGDPDRAIPTFHKGSVGIRKGDYRLIRYEDGSIELFDIVQDWWQLKNLGRDHAAFPGMMAALIACAADYGLAVSDTGTPA